MPFSEFKKQVALLSKSSVNHENRLRINDADLKKLGRKNAVVVMVVGNNKVTAADIAGAMDLVRI